LTESHSPLPVSFSALWKVQWTCRFASDGTVFDRIVQCFSRLRLFGFAGRAGEGSVECMGASQISINYLACDDFAPESAFTVHIFRLSHHFRFTFLNLTF